MIKNKALLVKGTFANERKSVLNAFEHALQRIDPAVCIESYVQRNGNMLKIGDEILDLSEFDRIYLIAFGKASVKMSKAIIKTIDISEGIIASNEDSAELPENIRFIRGGHPISDENSLLSGKEILNFASKITDRDLTFILISGGGSALVEAPLVSLVDLQKTTAALMKTGADIYELNTVRKHLSNIKGGRLLKAVKGDIISLIISDVIGNSLDTIASGPTYFDSTTFSDARKVIKKYNLDGKIPYRVTELIDNGVKGKVPETLKSDSTDLKRVKNILVAANFDACMAAENYLKTEGYNTLYLGSRIQGEAREAAKVIGGIGVELFNEKLDIRKPAAIIFGGETTVTVKGNGKGGRNQEFTLAAAPFLSNIKGVFASIGTDGIDGQSDAAGAIADSETLNKALNMGMTLESFLQNNDSYHYFKALNDLIVTGRTGTNTADIAVLIVCGNCRGRVFRGC